MYPVHLNSDRWPLVVFHIFTPFLFCLDYANIILTPLPVLVPWLRIGPGFISCEKVFNSQAREKVIADFQRFFYRKISYPRYLIGYRLIIAPHPQLCYNEAEGR